jgi:hypothetical protein
MNGSSLGNIASLNFEISSSWLWSTLAVIFLIFAFVTLILMYHWSKYGRKEKGIFFTEAVYFVGAVFFLLSAVASIVAF